MVDLGLVNTVRMADTVDTDIKTRYPTQIYPLVKEYMTLLRSKI